MKLGGQQRLEILVIFSFKTVIIQSTFQKSENQDLQKTNFGVCLA